MMDDLISRQAAIDAINHICPVDTEYDCTLLDRVDVRYVLLDLPAAQPDTYWKEQCQSYERTINKLRASLSAKSESFEWCTDCKEYDQEKHCCPRWSKMIRKTVEEMQVVRCKDCKYAEYIDDVQTLWCTECGQGRTVAPYDFCSYGERRDDG